jgi:hypothetical protein
MQSGSAISAHGKHLTDGNYLDDHCHDRCPVFRGETDSQTTVKIYGHFYKVSVNKVLAKTGHVMTHVYGNHL